MSSKKRNKAAAASGGKGVEADLDEEFVQGKAWDSSILRRLSKYARPHWRHFAWSFAVLAMLFTMEVVGPWIWRHAIDGPVTEAIEAQSDNGTMLPMSGVSVSPYIDTFFRWVGLYVLTVLAAIYLRYQEVAALNKAGQVVIADLREKLFRHIQSLDLSFFDKRPTGSLVTRVTSDVENLNEMFTSGLIVLIFDMLKVVLLLALLFFLDWKLATVVLCGTPFLIGVSLIFRGGARNAHRSVRAKLSRLNGYLQEVLQGIRVVQVFRREKQVSERFAQHLDGYLTANLRTIFLFALFFPVIDVVVTAIQGSTLWVGGHALASNELSYGEFVQFWFYVAMLVAPIRELGERYNVLQSAFASAERIFDVLDTKTKLVTASALRAAASPTAASAPSTQVASAKSATIAPRAHATDDADRAFDEEMLAARAAIPRLVGHVRFEHVSFSYDKGAEVLDDVSFQIQPGQSVAVVGATGAGKSTLVNLLLRFYDPTRGRITIDGIDLADHDPDLLQRSFGLVMQEDFLFAGTVEENLVMDREDVTDDSLDEALAASRADQVIARLPGGLSAQVAERGVTFSTGERQLLAIARALAGNPRIVILDEATASVDSNTEAQIEAATRALLTGRSALVIAHRLSTVRNADRILVMHRGRLREQGTHDELLALNGIYARLYRLQFSEQMGASA